jgi:amino acid transporter
VASFIQAALTIGVIGLALATFPVMGLTPKDLNAPSSKVLDASANYPAVFTLLDFALLAGAAAILVLALVLHERWRNKSARLANLVVAVALIVTTLRICVALTTFVGTPRIIDLPSRTTRRR